MIGTTIRTALVTARAPSSLAPGQSLTKLGDHTRWVFIKPFTGAQPIQRKGRQNGPMLLGCRGTDRIEQVTSQPRQQPIKTLLKREIGVETLAVELIHQLH